MKTRVRVVLLAMAGLLVYLTAERVAVAGCVAECWENAGQICCTTERCTDYCL